MPLTVDLCRLPSDFHSPRLSFARYSIIYKVNTTRFATEVSYAPIPLRFQISSARIYPFRSALLRVRPDNATVTIHKNDSVLEQLQNIEKEVRFPKVGRYQLVW